MYRIANFPVGGQAETLETELEASMEVSYHLAYLDGKYQIPMPSSQSYVVMWPPPLVGVLRAGKLFRLAPRPSRNLPRLSSSELLPKAAGLSYVLILALLCTAAQY